MKALGRCALVLLGVVVAAVIPVYLIEGVAWGWNPNTSVPDYMFVVSFLWGLGCGVSGIAFASGVVSGGEQL